MPLNVRTLTVERSGRVLLDIPELRLDERPTLLVGANGAGKSTLFSALSGRIKPTRGEIDSAVAPVLVPQTFRPIIGFTTAEYCGYVAWLSGQKKKLARADAPAWLDFVGLSHVAAQKCETLSGGERARLAIATALNSGARLLLLDEPSAALDPIHKHKITEVYRRIAESGRELVVSSHDAGELGAPFTRVIVLDQGRILFDATPAAFLALAREPGEGPAHVLARSFAARRDSDGT